MKPTTGPYPGEPCATTRCISEVIFGHPFWDCFGHPFWDCFTRIHSSARRVVDSYALESLSAPSLEAQIHPSIIINLSNSQIIPFRVRASSSFSSSFILSISQPVQPAQPPWCCAPPIVPRPPGPPPARRCHRSRPRPPATNSLGRNSQQRRSAEALRSSQRGSWRKMVK